MKQAFIVLRGSVVWEIRQDLAGVACLLHAVWGLIWEDSKAMGIDGEKVVAGAGIN